MPCLWYGWQPTQLPTMCACSHPFIVDHSFRCKVDGFPIIHHTEICDHTVDLLSEVCHDVCVEPLLQPLSAETLSFVTANRNDSACLGLRFLGIAGCFFDVRVFNPTAPSYRSLHFTEIISNLKDKRIEDMRNRKWTHAQYSRW